MTATEAITWLDTAHGLTVTIDKKQQVTIHNGVTVKVTATGIVNAVVELQDVLKQMREHKDNAT